MSALSPENAQFVAAVERWRREPPGTELHVVLVDDKPLAVYLCQARAQTYARGLCTESEVAVASGRFVASAVERIA